MAYIITLRHGESYKNIKNIDGGKGESLTETGFSQVESSAKTIKQILEKLPHKNIKIFRSCDRTQITETTDILSDTLNVKNEIDPRFAPIRLGVFSGMSKAKQYELYPTSAKEMDEWCNGERDIMNVHVEGMQNPCDHVDKIIEFISSFNKDDVIILVGTRSDISAVKNIERGNHPALTNTYRFYPTEFAEVQVYSFENRENKLTFKKEDILERKNDGSEK